MKYKSLEELIDSKGSKMNRLLLSRYHLLAKINQGSFGKIYQALDLTSNKLVALKVEKIVDDFPTLNQESKMLRIVQDIEGIPKIYSAHKMDKKYIISMDLLGENLRKQMMKMKGPFSLQPTLEIANQLLTRIEQIHEKGVIHRDIKPENIVYGPGKTSGKIFLIDFGLAKSFLRGNGEHIPCKEGKLMVGTARFASVNTHKGIEQSRRDDLECFFYTLVFLRSCDLPWRKNFPNLSKTETYKKIQEMKEKFGEEQILKILPKEFVLFFEHVRNLKFEEKPNYEFLRNLIWSCISRLDFPIESSSFFSISPRKFEEAKNSFFQKPEEKTDSVNNQSHKTPLAVKVNRNSEAFKRRRKENQANTMAVLMESQREFSPQPRRKREEQRRNKSTSPNHQQHSLLTVPNLKLTLVEIENFSSVAKSRAEEKKESNDIYNQENQCMSLISVEKSGCGNLSPFPQNLSIDIVSENHESNEIQDEEGDEYSPHETKLTQKCWTLNHMSTNLKTFLDLKHGSLRFIE